MNFLAKNILVGLLLVSIFQVGCQKDDIAPARQQVAFVKYFGHVSQQEAADVKRTADGGYLLVGSTNSYDTEGLRDILVVKTDSLGNEEWSKTLGQPADKQGSNLTMQYDEVGVKAALLPDDAGYVIAGNRTIKNLTTVPTTEKTKIVLYQLDLTGGIVLSKVLRNTGTEAAFTEEISDIKVHVGNPLAFVITGYTTNLFRGKPGGIKSTDKTDIFTARLDVMFEIDWNQGSSTGSLAYGFDGNDYGTSVHIVSDGYIVIGTDQQSVNGLSNNIRAVKYRISSGAILNTRDYGGVNFDLVGGHSVIDTLQGLITIAATWNETSDKSSLAILQLDYLLELNKNGTSSSGYYFYNTNEVDERRLPNTGLNSVGNVLAFNDIAKLPSNNGFILTYTNTTGLDSDIGLLRVEQDLSISEGFPYSYGYRDQTGIDGTLERGGSVIPVTEVKAGTSQSFLTGYAFTGTFGLGTNNMMGLVKVNDRGTFATE